MILLCLGVSEGFQDAVWHLIDSGYLWNNSWKHIKKITSLYFTTGFPSRDRKFLPLPFTMPTFIDLGLSGRWLGVSGRCLEVVWVTLSTSGWVIIPNRLTKLRLISWFLFPQWSWIGHWVPYFGVSVGCLEDVWEVSWVVWVTGYWMGRGGWGSWNDAK